MTMTMTPELSTPATSTAPATVAADRVVATAARASGPWTRVCRYDDLEPAWGVAALCADGSQIALFRMPSGDVYAVDNADPKTGAMVLSRGLVGSKRVDGETVPVIASPLHKDTFDLRTGRCFTTPGLRLPIRRVCIVGGDVLVAPAAALLAISHGTSDPHGRAAVARLVEAAANTVPGAPVLGGFVDVQQPDVPSTLTAADGDSVIVPLLLATGYHVKHDIAGDVDAHGPSDVHITPALGPDARLTAIVARHLVEAGWNAERDAVVLAVAGSSDAAAVADGRRAGELLAEALGAPVDVGYLAGAGPALAEVVARTRAAHPDRRVIAASYLLAPGYFQSLAESASADATTRPLLVPDEPVAPELVAIVRERYLSGLPARRPRAADL